MKLLGYELCPYVSAARSIFGIKNVPFEFEIVPFNEEKRLIDLVGSKQCPILIKDDGAPMKESTDIILYIDANYGGEPVMKEVENPKFKDWLARTTSSRALYKLVAPRYANAGTNFPDFPTQEALEYYSRKKQDPAFGVGNFMEAYANSDQYKKEIEESLAEIEQMLKSETRLNGGDEITFDDISLFVRLRCLTIVKGLNWPAKVKAYLDSMIQFTKVSSLEQYAN